MFGPDGGCPFPPGSLCESHSDPLLCVVFLPSFGGLGLHIAWPPRALVDRNPAPVLARRFPGVPPALSPGKLWVLFAQSVFRGASRRSR